MDMIYDKIYREYFFRVPNIVKILCEFSFVRLVRKPTNSISGCYINFYNQAKAMESDLVGFINIKEYIATLKYAFNYFFFRQILAAAI